VISPPQCFNRKKRLVTLAPESCLIAEEAFEYTVVEVGEAALFLNFGFVCWPADHAWHFSYRCRQRQWKPPQVFCPKLLPADGFQTTARAGCDGRIKPGGFPSCGFIATAMDLAMVSSKNGTVNSSLTLRPSAVLCEAPSGSRHRLENPARFDLELIEVQTGSHLGEDDIIRIEDDCHRA
jgi:hypothetical protein